MVVIRVMVIFAMGVDNYTTIAILIVDGLRLNNDLRKQHTHTSNLILTYDFVHVAFPPVAIR